MQSELNSTKLLCTAFALWLLLSFSVVAAQFKQGDEVKLTRDEPIYFDKIVYSQGKSGETFTVFQYRQDLKRVFISAQDRVGNQIALSIREDAVVLVPKGSGTLRVEAINAARGGRFTDAMRLIDEAVRSNPVDSSAQEIKTAIAQMLEATLRQERVTSEQKRITAEAQRLRENASVTERPSRLDPRNRSGQDRAKALRAQADSFEKSAHSLSPAAQQSVEVARTSLAATLDKEERATLATTNIPVPLPTTTPSSYAQPPTVTNQPTQSTPAQKVVIVTGIGKDITEARKSAYSRAVEEAVGLVVTTDTIVKNEKVIHEQILTYSGALVSKSETLGSEAKGGLFEVKIRATVEMNPLLQKLKEANVAVRELSGESLFATAVTQLKERQDGQSLLLDVFRDFPLSVMRTEVCGQPQVVKSDGVKATVSCKVRFTIDQAKFTAFSQRLRTVLRQTGHQPSATQLRAIEAPKVSRVPGFEVSLMEPGMFTLFPKHPTNDFYVFLHLQSDSTNSVSSWEMYRIRPEFAKTLLLLSVNSLKLTIRFLDSAAKEVMLDESGLFMLTRRYAWSFRSPITYAFGQTSLDRFNFVPMGEKTKNGAMGVLDEFEHPFKGKGRNDHFFYIAPYFSLIHSFEVVNDRSVVEQPGGSIYNRQVLERKRFFSTSCESTREIQTDMESLQRVTKVIASLSSSISLPPDAKPYSFGNELDSEQNLTQSLKPGEMINYPTNIPKRLKD